MGGHRKNPGLGELSPDLLRERSVAGKRIHSPGERTGFEWINNYSQSNYPFVIGIASEQIIPANPLRSYVLIQNKNAASDMFINFGSAANAFNGIIIVPRGNYELIGGAVGGSYCPRDSINILGAVAGMQGVITEGVLLPT